MPRIRLQKSRLNSLVCNDDLDEERSLGYEDLSEEAVDDIPTTIPEETEDKQPTRPLTRTEILILDYVQFKVARTIQSVVRGWLCRRRLQRMRWAAIIIQKEWRRFYYQRKYFQKVEAAVQQAAEQFYNRAATKIQAFYRGWWVRHYVHDHSRLMHLQLLAGEDLLRCVAFKLHHLLRTHQIPGVYSLRNTNALSQVEQLLASLSFKTCNQRAFEATLQRRYEFESAKKQHVESKFGTKVPYTGPNIHNICEPQCHQLSKIKDSDIRMANILKTYEETQRELAIKAMEKRRKTPKKRRKLAYPAKRLEFLTKSSSFCTDVVKSMKKWKILAANNRTVDPNIFKQPQNVENFLKEIESMMSFIQGNCLCRREFEDELNKEKLKVLEQQRSAETKSHSESSVNEILLTTIKGPPEVSDGVCSSTAHTGRTSYSAAKDLPDLPIKVETTKDAVNETIDEESSSVMSLNVQ